MSSTPAAGPGSIEPGGWIGPTPRRGEIVAALFMGISALLIAGLQPIVLGALAREGRLTTEQIGLAATVELLALGISSALAGALFQPRRLRAIAAAAASVHCVGTLASMAASGAAIIAARTVTGLSAGILLWVTLGLIARARNPARWSGMFLALQTLTQLAFATVLPIAVIPRFGADGALASLAAVSLLTALAALFGPSTYGELPVAQRAPPLTTTASAASRDTKMLPGAALASLLASGLYMAFIVAVWVYLEPLALQSGLSPQIVGIAVALALGCQVAGGTLAAMLGNRVPWHLVLLGGGAINLALLAVLAVASSAFVFVACVAVFGFLWLFVMPYHVLLLIDADPTRRAALLVAGAQLVGSSMGPFMASFFVSPAAVDNVLIMGATCLVLSLAMIGLIRARVRPGHAAAMHCQPVSNERPL